MGWREKAKRAKRLHRPSLKDWTCDGMAWSFPRFVESLNKRPNYEAFIPGTAETSASGGSGSGGGNSSSASSGSGGGISSSAGGGIAVPAILDANTTSVETFQQEYEARGIPSVIRGIPEKEMWPATRRWTDLERLENDPDLRNRLFKVGEDDDGKSVKMKLKHFMRYLRDNRDDSPLYIFDSAFDEDRGGKQLLKDYKVPSYFDEDLFHLVGERRRPPYRWFLIGPERSGTCVHIDPLGTAAWNTLLYGQKRWVLFPPQVPKHIAKGKGLVRKNEDDEAVHYFDFILPRIKRRAAASGGTGDYQDFACYEFTQHPGETVYVPYGWWHAVLNVTHTVAITQNFCSQRNFDIVWTKTRTGRKKMAYKWLCQLDTHYPHLAKRARELNAQSNFVMKYEPEEVKKREEEEDRRRKAKREAKEAKKELKRKAKVSKSKSSYQRADSTSSSRASSVSGGIVATTTTVDDRDSSKRLKGSSIDVDMGRGKSRAISPDTVS